MEFEKIPAKEVKLGTKRDQIEQAVSQIEPGQALRITGESVNTIRTYVLQIFGSGKYSIRTDNNGNTIISHMENK